MPNANTDKRYSLNKWMGEMAAEPGQNWNKKSVADFALLGTHDSTTSSFNGKALLDEYRQSLGFWEGLWKSPAITAFEIAAGANILELFIKTQNLSITDQLNNGVRFLDYRLGWKNSRVEMYHGPVSVFRTFEDAMNDINSFLNANPTEFVLVSLKRDDGDENTVRNWLSSKQNDSFIKNRVYIKSGIPTYEEAKGKIVILDRGIGGLTGTKVDIENNTRYSCETGKNHAVQDAYDADTFSEDDKIRAIEDFFRKAMLAKSKIYDKNCDGRYRLNFISFSRSFARMDKLKSSLFSKEFFEEALWNMTNVKTPRSYCELFNPRTLDLIKSVQPTKGITIIDSFDGDQMRDMAQALIKGNLT